VKPAPARASCASLQIRINSASKAGAYVKQTRAALISRFISDRTTCPCLCHRPLSLGRPPSRLGRRHSATPGSSGYSNQAGCPSRALSSHSIGQVEGPLRGRGVGEPRRERRCRLWRAGLSDGGRAQQRQKHCTHDEPLHRSSPSWQLNGQISVPNGGENVALISELLGG
jgi:hypothetical protein